MSTHIECVKKWPAIYAFMARVMDDVMVDREKAIDIWGDHVVSISEVRNNEAMHEDDVRGLLTSLIAHLGVEDNHVIASYDPAEHRRRTAARASDATTAPPARSGSAGTGDFDEPGRSDYKTRYAKGRGKDKPKSWLEGKVTNVWAVEKEARFGGGHRHMMMVKQDGKEYGVEGTIPATHINRIEPVDRVKLKAKVWSFDTKKGWFKYPSDMTILEKA